VINTDPYIKMLFGIHAARVPIQMSVQDMGANLVAAVLVSPSKDLAFGSKCCHQLVLGDAVIRPHLVLETDELKGQGLSGLATMHPEDWVAVSRVLINPAGRGLP
jgi:hypothetical protein